MGARGPLDGRVGHRRALYSENSARVHGVVCSGAGNIINDALAGTGVPAMRMTGGPTPSYSTPQGLEKAAHKLPKDTETVVVEGGNHRGFAHYTHQALDWEATITPQEQQRIVVDALVDFIGRRVVAGEPSKAHDFAVSRDQILSSPGLGQRWLASHKFAYDHGDRPVRTVIIMRWTSAGR